MSFTTTCQSTKGTAICCENNPNTSEGNEIYAGS